MERKKLFISADIEGTCGIVNWDETEKNHPDHKYFAEQMTKEVSAACISADFKNWDVLVKDAHDSARNIIPDMLPTGTRLIRGWIGDLECMMGGLDREKFDAVAFTGYHSAAYTDGNSLAHTMTTSVISVKLNGKLCSEFVFNAYSAAKLGIPSVFTSGDKALCESAKELIPDICTVATKEGIGGACISRHPEDVTEEIRETMVKALEPEHVKKCLPVLPKHFAMEIMYRETAKAYRNSFYPGARLIDPKTVLFETDDYTEIERAIHFVL